MGSYTRLVLTCTQSFHTKNNINSLKIDLDIVNCVLLVLRLFVMKYCFSNPVEETFKLSVNLLIYQCQILPTVEKRLRHCDQSTLMVA